MNTEVLQALLSRAGFSSLSKNFNQGYSTVCHQQGTVLTFLLPGVGCSPCCARGMPLSVRPRGAGGAAESQVGRGAVGGVLAPSCTAVPVAVGLHSNTERELLRTAGPPQATAC